MGLMQRWPTTADDERPVSSKAWGSPAPEQPINPDVATVQTKMATALL
jgi:hypothetical protein